MNLMCANANCCPILRDFTNFWERTVTNTDLKPISQLRFHCDTTTTRLRRKIDMLIFCSRRIASNGSRRARHVV